MQKCITNVSLVTATTIFFNQVLGSVICAPVPNLVAIASTLLISHFCSIVINHLLLDSCHGSPPGPGLPPLMPQGPPASTTKLVAILSVVQVNFVTIPVYTHIVVDSLL